MSGNTQSKLSERIEQKAMKVFRAIDTDGSKTIDRQETIKFWKSNFAKLNTNELFNAVDADKNGNISEDEWMDFWREVRKSGHSEKEIESEVIKERRVLIWEQLDNLIEGEAWVKFDKVASISKKN